MGRQRKQVREYPGQLQWVRMPMGEHRWTGGPVVCVWTEDGWMVELSRHGERGRVSVPLDGPFFDLEDAKEAAGNLILRAQVNRHRKSAANVAVAA